MEESDNSKQENNSSLFLLKLLFTNKIQKVCKFCSAVVIKRGNINYFLISMKYLFKNSQDYINKLYKKKIDKILKRKPRAYLDYKDKVNFNKKSNSIEIYYNSNSRERNMKDLCKIYQFAVLKPKVKHRYFKDKIRKCVLTLKLKREEAFRELLQEYSFSRLSNINIQVLDKFMKTQKKTIIISKKKNSGVLPSLSSISHDPHFPPFQSSISRVTLKQKPKISSNSSLIKKDFSINQIDIPMNLSDFHRKSDNNLKKKKKKKLIYNLKTRKKTSSVTKIHKSNFSCGNIDKILKKNKLNEKKEKISIDNINKKKEAFKKGNLTNRLFHDFKNSIKYQKIRQTSKLKNEKSKITTQRKFNLDIKNRKIPKGHKKNFIKFIKKKDKKIKNKVYEMKVKKKRVFINNKIQTGKNKIIIPNLYIKKKLKNIIKNRKKSLQEVLYPSLTLKKKKKLKLKLKKKKNNLIQIPEKIKHKKKKKEKDDFQNFFYK